MKKFAPFLIFLGFCALLAQLMLAEKTTPTASPRIGKTIAEVALDGQPLQGLFTQPFTIINVFASWCLPCQIEHPLLLALKKQTTTPILGIAWKDKRANIEQWVSERGNPYHHILHDEKGESTIALGLTGVPETFVVDAKGVIIFHTQSPMNESMINEIKSLVSP